MGSIISKCMAPSPPPVVFTICPVDGKAHDLGEKPEPTATCSKCKMTREAIDRGCQECRNDNHLWMQDYEPVPGAAPSAPIQPGVAQATPVMVIHKCQRCGLRRRPDENGIYYYDDYYMYGGGFMMGVEMGMMFGIMGAADAAYMDPMYGEYYGDVDGGFMADDGFDADDGGDFDFD